MILPVSEHRVDRDCWCEPVLEYVAPAGTRLYIHRENGGADPPPRFLVEMLRGYDSRLRPRRDGPEEIHVTRLGAFRSVPARFSLDEMGLEGP
jgi:hypothetical protein